MIALLPAALQCEWCANTRDAAVRQLYSGDRSYGTRALLECHGVHVCAFADEQLHDTQVAVPSRFVQGGEAFSAKQMGGEGWEQALPLSAGLKVRCAGVRSVLRACHHTRSFCERLPLQPTATAPLPNGHDQPPCAGGCVHCTKR